MTDKTAAMEEVKKLEEESKQQQLKAYCGAATAVHIAWMVQAPAPPSCLSADEQQEIGESGLKAAVQHLKLCGTVAVKEVQVPSLDLHSSEAKPSQYLPLRRAAVVGSVDSASPLTALAVLLNSGQSGEKTLTLLGDAAVLESELDKLDLPRLFDVDSGSEGPLTIEGVVAQQRRFLWNELTLLERLRVYPHANVVQCWGFVCSPLELSSGTLQQAERGCTALMLLPHPHALLHSLTDEVIPRSVVEAVAEAVRRGGANGNISKQVVHLLLSHAKSVQASMSRCSGGSLADYLERRMAQHRRRLIQLWLTEHRRATPSKVAVHWMADDVSCHDTLAREAAPSASPSPQPQPQETATIVDAWWTSTHLLSQYKRTTMSLLACPASVIPLEQSQSIRVNMFSKMCSCYAGEGDSSMSPITAVTLLTPSQTSSMGNDEETFPKAAGIAEGRPPVPFATVHDAEVAWLSAMEWNQQQQHFTSSAADTTSGRLHQATHPNPFSFSMSLTERETTAIAVAMLAALHHLHRVLHILHRDVKPENILVCVGHTQEITTSPSSFRRAEQPLPSTATTTQQRGMPFHGKGGDDSSLDTGGPALSIYLQRPPFASLATAEEVEASVDATVVTPTSATPWMIDFHETRRGRRKALGPTAAATPPPSAIFVLPQNEAWRLQLADLGVCTEPGQIRSSQPGCGTPLYMAPEVLACGAMSSDFPACLFSWAQETWRQRCGTGSGNTSVTMTESPWDKLLSTGKYPVTGERTEGEADEGDALGDGSPPRKKARSSQEPSLFPSYGPPADIFSLGVTLQDILITSLSIDFPTREQWMTAVLDQPPAVKANNKWEDAVQTAGTEDERVATSREEGLKLAALRAMWIDEDDPIAETFARCRTAVGRDQVPGRSVFYIPREWRCQAELSDRMFVRSEVLSAEAVLRQGKTDTESIAHQPLPLHLSEAALTSARCCPHLFAAATPGAAGYSTQSRRCKSCRRLHRHFIELLNSMTHTEPSARPTVEECMRTSAILEQGTFERRQPRQYSTPPHAPHPPQWKQAPSTPPSPPPRPPPTTRSAHVERQYRWRPPSLHFLKNDI